MRGLCAQSLTAALLQTEARPRMATFPLPSRRGTMRGMDQKPLTFWKWFPFAVVSTALGSAACAVIGLLIPPSLVPIAILPLGALAGAISVSGVAVAMWFWRRRTP